MKRVKREECGTIKEGIICLITNLKQKIFIKVPDCIRKKIFKINKIDRYFDYEESLRRNRSYFNTEGLSLDFLEKIRVNTINEIEKEKYFLKKEKDEYKRITDFFSIFISAIIGFCVSKMLYEIKFSKEVAFFIELIVNTSVTIVVFFMLLFLIAFFMFLFNPKRYANYNKIIIAEKRMKELSVRLEVIAEKVLELTNQKTDCNFF